MPANDELDYEDLVRAAQASGELDDWENYMTLNRVLRRELTRMVKPGTTIDLYQVINTLAELGLIETMQPLHEALLFRLRQM